MITATYSYPTVPDLPPHRMVYVRLSGQPAPSLMRQVGADTVRTVQMPKWMADELIEHLAYINDTNHYLRLFDDHYAVQHSAACIRNNQMADCPFKLPQPDVAASLRHYGDKIRYVHTDDDYFRFEPADA